MVFSSPPPTSAMINPADDPSEEELDNLPDNLVDMLDSSGDAERIVNGADFDDVGDPSGLPKSLIATNVDVSVFVTDSDARLLFEGMFKKFDDQATFQYFRSFRRVRINFTDSLPAARARVRCHLMKVHDTPISIFFAQSSDSPLGEEPSDHHLQLPPPVRQLLISPPASPPVGWEPCAEATPIINFELLKTLSTLAPGEVHELHPPSESKPAIVVHICEEEDEEYRLSRGKIQQTKRPPTTRSGSEGSEGSEGSGSA